MPGTRFYSWEVIDERIEEYEYLLDGTEIPMNPAAVAECLGGIGNSHEALRGFIAAFIAEIDCDKMEMEITGTAFVIDKLHHYMQHSYQLVVALRNAKETLNDDISKTMKPNNTAFL